MTDVRPIEVGDLVTIECTVTGLLSQCGYDYLMVYPGGLAAPSRDEAICVEALSAARVAPPEPLEPPPGSVVVKDGIAWARSQIAGWYGLQRGAPASSWSRLSDGKVIFIGGAFRW